MKIKIIFSLVFICFQTIILAQSYFPVALPGNSVSSSAKSPILSVSNGSQAIATSYTFSACGLDFMQVSNPLFGRTGNNFTLSVSQPAVFSVPAMPACAAIEKVFLYVGTSGAGVGINASISNPAGGNSVYPLTVIGSGPDKNWGYAGSYTYRADVTSIFSGPGNYIISGIPTGTSTAADDANGATLFIIYSDRTQNYTGSIVIADGSLVNTNGGAATATISGFNVCGTPTLTSHFMLVDDLQQYGTSNLSLNSPTANLVQLPALTTPWEFFSAAGNSVTAGQNSAVYEISNLADTVGMLVAGLYYRSTCLVCPSTLSLTAASTPSCLASATVNVSGGMAPYTYSWTGSAQNTAVITDLAAGTQTVTASDQLGCLSGSATLIASNPAPAIAINNATACIGFGANLVAGAAAGYTWSPAASLDNPNIQNVVATPLSTTIYTLNYVNALGCTGSQTAQVVITMTQNVGASSTTLCALQGLNLFSNGYTGVYTWTGPGGYTSSQPNPVIANTSTATSGAYNLSVTSVAGCTSIAVSNVTVFPLPTTSITSNAPLCSGFNLTLNGSGATFYTWQGPNNFVSFLPNTSISPADTLASGIYTLNGSFANGCARTTTKTLLVTGLPQPSIMTTTNVCVGRNVTFSVTGGPFNQYTWVGPNNFNSNQASPSINAITLAANGPYTLTVADASGCQGIATTTMAAIANPTVTATGTTVCYGSAATLTANGVGYYTWFGPAGYSVSPLVPVTTVSVVNNLTAGIYTVQLISLATTCSAVATTTLSTLALPTVIATGTNVCLNEPATLTVTGASTYSWTGPSGYTALGANPLVPLTNSLSTGIYTVLGTALTSCTSIATATLGTIPLPTVTASGTLICLNEPFTLTSAGAASYTWSGPSAYSAIGANAYVPIVNNLSTGEYTVVGTAPNTCTQVTTTTLQTMPLPNITTTGTVVCLNEPALLQAFGGMPDGSKYKWTGPAAYTSTLQNAAIISATNVPATIYTVVGTAPNTCTNVATASLFTMPLPTVTATGTLICFGEPFNIAANGAVSYSWTGPAAYTYTGQPAFVQVVDSVSSGIYIVTGTAANTCTQVTTTTLATMPLPNITATGTTVCIYQQPGYLLSAGGINGGYSWTGPNGYTSSAQNAYIPSATSISPQNYRVVGTAPNTCTNDAVATLYTFPLPQPTFVAPARVCFGSSVTVQAFGAQTYTWSGPYGQVYPYQNKTFPIYNFAQAGTYTLTVIDLNNCMNDTTTDIRIDPWPEGELVSNNANKNCVPYCSEFHLKNKNASPLVSSIWSINGTSQVGLNFRYCASKPGIDSVNGFFTDLNGCRNSINFTIKAYPSPKADFMFSPQKPLENIDEVEFKNLSSGENLSLWSWSFINNGGFTSFVQNPRYTFDNAGNYEVAMVVENEWGCVDTAVKTIVVSSDFKLYVPNVFTPNGDGINDVFQPKGRGVKKYEFNVYNRWGSRMFHTSDFEQGWDGVSNGNMSENDVYIWKIEAVDVSGKKWYYSGHVTLAR